MGVDSELLIQGQVHVDRPHCSRCRLCVNSLGSWPVTPAVVVEARCSHCSWARAPVRRVLPDATGPVDIEVHRIWQRFRWAVFGSWRSAPGPVMPTAFDLLAALVCPLCRGSEWSGSSQSFLGSRVTFFGPKCVDYAPK